MEKAPSDQGPLVPSAGDLEESHQRLLLLPQTEKQPQRSSGRARKTRDCLRESS